MLLEYCQSLKSFYPFFSEKRRVEFKITLINSEVSRNFFFSFRILFLNLMIELKKCIGKTCQS